jgi:peptide subunit release factor 1 (eRF1)
MTPADRIERCEHCGWQGEPTERCPDCEKSERIAENAEAIWCHAVELAAIVGRSLYLIPRETEAREALRQWDVTANQIENP